MSGQTLSGPSAVARGRTYWPRWLRITTALAGVAGVGAVAVWVLWPRVRPERAPGATTGSTWSLGRPFTPPAAPAASAVQSPREERREEVPSPPPPPEAPAAVEVALAAPMDSWSVPPSNSGRGRDRDGAPAGRDPAAASETPATASSEYAQRMQATKFGPVAPRPVRLPPDYTLKPGTVFDCVPPMPIGSEMVGSVQCSVQGNVWSMSGRTILIPDQATVHGTIERGLANGERRLWMVWQYAITPAPDFQMIPLDAPAADEMGQMGVPGDVNERLWQRLKTTLLLSGVEFVTGVGVAAAQDGARNVFNFGSAASGLGRSTNSLAEMAFARDMNIPITLERGPARTLKVYINRPVNLEHFYRNVVIRR